MKSLGDANASINASNKKGFWKKLFAFLGPAYLVSVGYMDPGNWATDLAGGSEFGYTLIWVLLMSNLMAILLQSLSARLGLVRKMDLAQASRATYPPFVNFCLYILAEIAIAATDLAEVLGMAIGLQLLFGLPLLWGVSLTVADTFLFLILQTYGMRKMEAFIISLVAIIGGAFLIEMVFAKPDMGELAQGFIPTIPNHSALYIAIGIIGATVMPHNLYLHSSLVQTRKINPSPKGIWAAIRFNIIDSAVALNLAFFVNAAILVLAAATFHKNGMYDIAEIQDAHKLLTPMLGSKWAAILFAVALIAAGQSSTITGTLAGQIVMEGYLHLRIQPWLRRLLTRLIAIVPAFLVIYIYGEKETGKMLIFSQVLLSLQLGFAVIPLIHFVSDKKKMGEFAIKLWVKIAAWIIAAVVVVLNVKLVVDEMKNWMIESEGNSYILWLTVVPLALAIMSLLLYITFKPLMTSKITPKTKTPHGAYLPIDFHEEREYKRIAIAVDFSDIDNKTINSALSQGGHKAEYSLIHIVESAGAFVMGSEIHDLESTQDALYLNKYVQQMTEKGYKVKPQLGFGNPKRTIPKLVKHFNADLLVMGSHGHGWFMDILFGTTVSGVRHKLKIPLFIVKEEELENV
ncbi:Nramp family divalent metal transporter [Fulvivirga maritima]|uniref:Nramp family divalent metal transporter n=1 Tax=Fulvivirga maritima TaxID=2904247 RepID=UPI001F1B76C7|nr:Nramp family divalent metal transporter [Fulvivirga maritima]UII26312.1 Nramp family divalent metal transporter [Fulvivirga maritima]